MRDDYSDSLQSKNLKLYLSQIAQLKPLSQEEEKELGPLIKQGDKAALM